MLKVAIYGGSGYTGFELLRILATHPEAEVVSVTSRQYAGEPVTGVFPSLAGYYDGLVFTDPVKADPRGVDVAFSALPHGASQAVVPGLLEKCGRVIDLSADYRLTDPGVYAEWYGEHSSPGLIGEAAYGLPELHREEIRSARLVANPGCYPTGAVLALAPLSGLIGGGPVIIDSKSGVSGAGRGANLGTSFVEVNGGFKAYKIGTHRHAPEIAQELTGRAGSPVDVVFTPHLLPVSRGILTTAYATLTEESTYASLRALFEKAYGDEPFVRLAPAGEYPDIKHVRLSNFCDIGLWTDGSKVIVVSAIDNLVKGASGQAVHNMNIMTGLDEETGLASPPASA